MFFIIHSMYIAIIGIGSLKYEKTVKLNEMENVRIFYYSQVVIRQ